MLTLFSIILKWAHRILFKWISFSLLCACGQLRYYGLGDPDQGGGSGWGGAREWICQSVKVNDIKKMIDADDQDIITRLIQDCDGQKMKNIFWLDYVRYAAANNKIKALTVLLGKTKELNIDLNSRQGNITEIYSPLHILHMPIYALYKEVINKLLDAGVDISYMCDDALVALVSSCRLFDGQSNAKCQHFDSQEALHQARLDIATLLIDHGAPVEGKNPLLYKPLNIAASNGDMGLVDLFLDKGANIDGKASNGNTPFYSALSSGHIEMATFLANKGANIQALEVDAMNNIHRGNTGLHYAAKFGNLFLVERFLKAKADIEAKNRDGNMPLHLAAQSGHLEVFKLLLNKGSGMEAKNNEDNTPLHLASSSGQLKVVEYLTDQEANMEAKNYEGNTPLYLAVEAQQIEVIAELLNQGADTEAKNINGYTPIHMAAALKYCKAFALLQQKRSSIEENIGSISGGGTTLKPCNDAIEQLMQRFLATNSTTLDEPNSTINAIPSSVDPEIEANQPSGASQLDHSIPGLLPCLAIQGMGYGNMALPCLLGAGPSMYDAVSGYLNLK